MNNSTMNDKRMKVLRAIGGATSFLLWMLVFFVDGSWLRHFEVREKLVLGKKVILIVNENQ